MNILFFLYLALIILYYLKLPLIRIFFLLLLSIIATFQLISLYTINKFIGYEFFANIEPELILAFYKDFIDQILYAIIFLIIFPFVFYLLVKPLKNILKTSKFNNIFICFLLVSFLSLENNIFGKFYELILII